MEVLALLFFLIYIIYLFVSRSSSYKGQVGERKVRNKIETIISSNHEYYSLHDLTLQTPDGTTQIDHVLISPNGIFVIETKNYKGWIFGSENQKQWTQTLYKKKYRFQNPLRQNYKHIKAVQNLLNVKMKSIISVVVFVGDSKFKTVMPYNVMELRDFLPFIRSHTEEIISSENVERFFQILSSPEQNISTSQLEHVANVEQNKQYPLCPRCGKSMVLRTARKGSGAGTEFWGCSGFPNCKATKNVN